MNHAVGFSGAAPITISAAFFAGTEDGVLLPMVALGVLADLVFHPGVICGEIEEGSVTVWAIAPAL